MKSRLLYLVVDTNLFIQCKPLEDLDWSQLGSYEEIILVLTQPVIREIDNQKSKGNDRVRKRARKTYPLIRQILQSEDEFIEVGKHSPLVKLSIAKECTASEEIKRSLDYNKPDDELVGCLATFIQQNPEETVRLFSHDAGPIASAKSVGLPFIFIPDDWLVEPESTPEERQMHQMEAELRRYKKAEPDFHIAFSGNTEPSDFGLLYKYKCCEPLEKGVIVEFLDSLKAAFPLASDFGPRESIQREVAVLGGFKLGLKEEYTPPTEEEIKEYTEAYSNWLEECEKFFDDLHNSLQRNEESPAFCLSVINQGTRPAKDALIKIQAKGKLKIRPHGSKKKRKEKEIQLPNPPTAPTGSWGPLISGIGSLNQILAGERAWQRCLSGDMFTRQEMTLPDLSSLSARYDPNGFYYKNRPSVPANSYTLECQQWRHNSEEEDFSGNIYFNLKAGMIQGAIECQIHAENLTTPVVKNIPVRIELEGISLKNYAQNLVDALIKQKEMALKVT